MSKTPRKICRSYHRCGWLIGGASLVLFGLLFCAACNDSAPDGNAAKPAPVEVVKTKDVGEAAEQADEPQAADETWDVIYMHDAPIGSLHVAELTIDEDGKRLVQVTGTLRVKMKRLGDVVEIDQTAQTVETEQGELLRFRSEMRAGPSTIVVVGTRDGDKMKKVTTIRGNDSIEMMDWQPSYGGFFAVERSLRKKPMQPSEKRTVFELSPSVSGVVIAEATLEAEVFEATKLLNESRQLLRITNVSTIGNSRLEGVHWTDRDGVPWKSQIVTLGQTVYRTTKDVAQKATQSAEFDVGAASLVKIDRPLKHPHATKTVTYLASLKHQDPAKTFFDGVSQTVTPVDEHTARIVVRAIRPDQPIELNSKPDAPTNAETAPNTLIQSDDPRIVEIARQIAANETDSWMVAQALEQHVRTSVRAHNYSHAFASAADVAEKGEGDCTEHAVLLAALCRARNIPARVAVGLIYVESLGGFAFHMWTEVWIKDRWIPVDGTLGRGGIGAAHIKLVHSSLADGTDFDAFLPVAQVIGQLELKVDDVQ